MNKKIAKLKQKIKENSGTITVFTVATVAATTAFFIHKSNRALEESNQTLREANDEMEDTNQMMRVLFGAIRHARETGHSTTIYNERGNPLFDVSAPSED